MCLGSSVIDSESNSVQGEKIGREESVGGREDGRRREERRGEDEIETNSGPAK